MRIKFNLNENVYSKKEGKIACVAQGDLDSDPSFCCCVTEDYWLVYMIFSPLPPQSSSLPFLLRMGVS